MVSSNNSRLEVMVLCITMSGLKGVVITLGRIVDGGDSLACKLRRKVSINSNKRQINVNFDKSINQRLKN